MVGRGCPYPWRLVWGSGSGGLEIHRRAVNRQLDREREFGPVLLHLVVLRRIGASGVHTEDVVTGEAYAHARARKEGGDLPSISVLCRLAASVRVARRDSGNGQRSGKMVVK